MEGAGGFDGGVCGIATGVAVFAAGACEGLGFVFDGEDAEDDGDAGVEGGLADAGGGLGGDGFEVVGFAADDAADDDDGLEASAGGGGFGGDGEFEAAGDAEEFAAGLVDAEFGEAFEAAGEEAVDDGWVPACGDNGHAQPGGGLEQRVGVGAVLAHVCGVYGVAWVGEAGVGRDNRWPMALSGRVLTILQFTRAALVFTAVADMLAALLISRANGGVAAVGWGTAVLAVAASCCLYGFGMALNDLVDRRRDALLAATRPLPSGRLGVSSAHAVVACLGTLSLGFGLTFAWLVDNWGTAVFVVLTMLLINFYNFAAKYLVSTGLLTLGVVRLFHASIASPDLPVVWHPLWLFTHVVVVSTVAYVWEEKRPRITPLHSAALVGGMAAVNVGLVTAVLARKLPRVAEGTDPVTAVWSVLAFWPQGEAGWGGVAWPMLASFGFAGVAWRIGRGIATSGQREVEEGQLPPPLRERRRRAGRQLILAGLMWLIVYDAAFVLGYVGWREAVGVLVLLPLAYGAVRLMRLASLLAQASEPPTFRLPRA